MTKLNLGCKVAVRFAVVATLTSISDYAHATSNAPGNLDWPAWTQAVGSILAILVAVWVPYKQRIDDAANEKELRKIEARRILLAIRDELKALSLIFTTGPNVLTLLKLEPGDIFNRIISTPPERFRIYHSVVGRLTLIESDDLRRDIIGAFETAEALMHLARENNRVLFDLEQINEVVHYRNDDFQTARREHCIANLQQSAASMKIICKETVDRVTKLLPLLDLAID